MDMIEAKALGLEIDVKAISAEGEFEGYASTFGNADHVGDVILPGAFKKSIRGGNLPPMLWQHKMDQPIGVWTAMREDDAGLLAKGRFLSTSAGKDAYTTVKEGAVKGLSIGFTSDDWQFNKTGKGRTIKTVNLMEVSVVTLPCNSKATIFDVKTIGGELASLLTPRVVEKALRDAGFSRSERARAVLALKANNLLRDAEDEPADEAPRDEEGLADLMRALEQRAASFKP